GWSEKWANVLTDLRRDLVGAGRAVEGDDALWELGGEPTEPLVRAPPELLALPLDSVRVTAAAPPRRVGIEQHEERPVRKEPVGAHQVELADAVFSEPARGALVGDGRVQVAVADDVVAARERRPDRVRDVVCPGRGVERGLGPGSHIVAVQDDLAH